jgi:hypothetical protein
VEFRGHGSGDLVTLGIEEGAGKTSGEPYWRMREYEEKKALDIEERNKRLWTIGWKTGRSRAKVMAMAELRHESPEVFAWGQERRKGSLIGALGWLTDLLLRVPKLERCDM